jgi:bifunctional DNA-binding transcriptional regulator/antitoxin component of YhaV-PrlF toxin-antitoxin module
MAMGDGVQMLPIKSEIRKAIGKEAGDVVEIIIQERL